MQQLISDILDITTRSGDESEIEQLLAQRLQEERFASLAEFAAGAGHEINNPLAVISGRAQLLLRQSDDPEVRTSLATIAAEANRVYEMIADVMAYARPPAPERKPTDILRLVNEAADAEWKRHTTLFPQTQIELNRPEPSSSEIRLEVDPEQLRVSIAALIRNAFEALGHAGSVSLNVAIEKERLCLSVSDNGPGLSEEAARHLFDPYYSERQAGRGLGFGLCKARRFVEQHGGEITWECPSTGGAIFRIELPL